MSGLGTWIFLSNLPGRVAAGSSVSWWLVAPITQMFSFFANPSISERSWFMVALDELDSTLDLRVSEIRVSISSIKIIHGYNLRAILNSCLTREAPTPTNISSKSDPEQKIKLQPDSPAIARAINVLPVPGSPYSIIPLCSLHPFSRYLSGCWSILITFWSSSLISSIPLTSSNR